jgi:hypothetical protein
MVKVYNYHLKKNYHEYLVLIFFHKSHVFFCSYHHIYKSASNKKYKFFCHHLFFYSSFNFMNIYIVHNYRHFKIFINSFSFSFSLYLFPGLFLFFFRLFLTPNCTMLHFFFNHLASYQIFSFPLLLYIL